MDIYDITPSRVKRILNRQGYFVCDRNDFAHAKARRIMAALVKDGVAHYDTSYSGELICIRKGC